MYIIDEWDLNEFRPEDYLDEISNEDLKAECKRRNIELINITNITSKDFWTLNKMQQREFLTDCVGLSHMATNDEILEAIKNVL